MSVNGVDYTKKLSKERDYFHEQSNRVKQNAQREIEHNKQLANKKIETQKENYIKDRTDLEKNYKENIDRITEKTMQSEFDSVGKLQDERQKEREDFTAEMNKKGKDFSRRLDDIKSSYRKSFDAERHRHGEVEDKKSEKYFEQVTNLKSDLDSKIKNYQQRLSGAGEDLKDQYNRERQQLVRAQEDRLVEVFTDASQKRTALKDRIENELKILRDAKEAEFDQLQNYNQDRFLVLQANSDHKIKTVQGNYSQRNDRVVQNHKEATQKSEKERQEQVAGLQREISDVMRKTELEKRRRDNGSGDFADFRNKQQGLTKEMQYEKKIEALGKQLIDTKKEGLIRLEDERDKMNETIREQNIEAMSQQEKKLNEASADRLVAFSREREQSDKKIQNRENQNKMEKQDSESMLTIERKNAKERLTNLKEAFNKSMISIEEKHKDAISQVTATSIKDKNDFTKKLEERRRDEVFDMKRSFGKMMDATVQDYENRIAAYQRENEYLKMTMDQKISNLTDQTQKELESQQKHFEDLKAADTKAQQLLMDQRDAQLKQNFRDMNLNYQRKIDKMTIENDTKFKLMVNDYETKLKDLKTSSSKAMAEKEIAHQIQLDTVKNAHEADKTRLVNTYEAQLEAMKNGHESQLRQMSDYKRLS